MDNRVRDLDELEKQIKLKEKQIREEDEDNQKMRCYRNSVIDRFTHYDALYTEIFNQTSILSFVRRHLVSRFLTKSVFFLLVHLYEIYYLSYNLLAK